MDEFTDKCRIIEEILADRGYPKELGTMIARELGTPSTMNRMIAYLLSAEPGSAEEIVDEMLAIIADRDKWREKKINEYYNWRSINS
ncbi:MAG: hypothetical protein PUC26_07740 [Eubacteriales bacterium]|jgi:hypothetical protein|nr:hypothetical protein [Eubacteriales bacterium]